MNDLIELIKIGGPSVATAAIFLYFIDKQGKRTDSMICNHFEHVAGAIDRNTKILSQLATLIKRLNGKRI